MMKTWRGHVHRGGGSSHGQGPLPLGTPGMQERDSNTLACAVFLLRVWRGHDGLLNMCNDILHHAQGAQDCQAAINELLWRADSQRLFLGNLVSMSIAHPIVV